MQPGAGGGAGTLDGTEVRLMRGGGEVVDRSMAERKVGDVPADQVRVRVFISVNE